MARKMNPAFKKMATKPLKPSAVLAAVIGDKPVSRPQAVKKLWEYFKKKKLQNPKNKRNIKADDLLKPLFGKAEITMFEVGKILNKHLSD